MRIKEKGVECILNVLLRVFVVWTLGVSMSADAGLFELFSEVSWREEVLLHDGQKIIIKRSQSYGGRHEVGQTPPIKEHDVTFAVPGSSKAIIWKSEYGEDIGRANFNLLAVHVLKGTPYLVASPNLCLSYNKWGRPNPPYVFYKYDGEGWQRISLEAFPAEFKTINLIVNNGREEDVKKAESKLGYVSAESVQKINSSLTQPEYKTILREAYPGAAAGCSELIRTNDGWEGLGFFKYQKSYEACLKYCDQKGVKQINCPCETLFTGAK